MVIARMATANDKGLPPKKKKKKKKTERTVANTFTHTLEHQLACNKTRALCFSVDKGVFRAICARTRSTVGGWVGGWVDKRGAGTDGRTDGRTDAYVDGCICVRAC